jgi:hypothetical protein
MPHGQAARPKKGASESAEPSKQTKSRFWTHCCGARSRWPVPRTPAPPKRDSPAARRNEKQNKRHRNVSYIDRGLEEASTGRNDTQDSQRAMQESKRITVAKDEPPCCCSRFCCVPNQTQHRVRKSLQRDTASIDAQQKCDASSRTHTQITKRAPTDTKQHAPDVEHILDDS